MPDDGILRLACKDGNNDDSYDYSCCGINAFPMKVNFNRFYLA